MEQHRHDLPDIRGLEMQLRTIEDLQNVDDTRINNLQADNPDIQGEIEDRLNSTREQIDEKLSKINALTSDLLRRMEKQESRGGC